MNNTINGKKLTRSQLRAFAAAERLKFTKPATSENRRNPYSGISCELSPEAVQLYDFITTSEFVCGKDYTRQEWDWARYTFHVLWPDEYYKLID